MWAALLGLMLVCSTMIFSPATADLGFGSAQAGGVAGAIQADVDVTRAGDLQRGDAFHRRQRSDDLLSDLARRLLQRLRQRKAHRQRQLAELAIAWATRR
jgi:hypothetical protein